MVAQQSADGIRQRAWRDLALQTLEGLQGRLPQGLNHPLGFFCPDSTHGGVDPDDNVFDRPACIPDPAGSGFGRLAQPGSVRGAGNHHDDSWSIDPGDPDLARQRRRQRAGQHRLDGQQFVRCAHHMRPLGGTAQPFVGWCAGRSVPPGRCRHGHEEFLSDEIETRCSRGALAAF